MGLAYKKSKVGDGQAINYYMNGSAVTRTGRHVDEYYAGLEGKEPPGTWHFAGTTEQRKMYAETLGLEHGAAFGELDSDAFKQLARGFNPRTGAAMARNSGDKNRVALHDFTFSPPKTFSVQWALADDATHQAIAEMQSKGVDCALEIFARKGAYSRTGDGKTFKKNPVGLIVAKFEHASSRANDPQLHTHATVLHLAIRADGTTGSIETQNMMAWQGAAASMYHAYIAWGARQLGANIRMNGKMPEIDGVPRTVVEAFSKRRKAIEDAVEKKMEALGLTSAQKEASRAMYQFQALETRDEKDAQTREELQAMWTAEGKALGFTEVEAMEVMRMGEPILELTANDLLVEARLAVATLTETEAVFTEADLYTAMAVHLCGKASVEQIEQAVEAIRAELVMTEVVQQRKAALDGLALPPTPDMLALALSIEERRLQVGEPAELTQSHQESFVAVRAYLDSHAGWHLGDTLKPFEEPAPEIEIIYSTKEMVLIEADLQERVRAIAPVHRLDTDVVEEALRSRDAEFRAAVAADLKKKGRPPEPGEAAGLEEEQRHAIRRTCLSQSSVSVIEGSAGTGKTTIAETVARLYRDAGYEVHGTSQAWAQAITLQQEAKLEQGLAIARWLNDVRSGNLTLTTKSLVLVDEAGLVGSRQMHQVIRAAQDAGAKVVLLGDTKQGTAVSAGDALRIVVAETGSARLDVIRRQNSLAEREAVHLFASGQAKEAMLVYKDRFHVCSNREATIEQLVADWQASRVAHPLAEDPKGNSHVIIAYDNLSVRALNLAAHAARSNAGELGNKRLNVVTMDSIDETDLIEIAEGDEVVFRTNNRGIDVKDRAGQKLSATYLKIVGKLDQLRPEEQRAQLQKAAESARKNMHRDAQEMANRIGRLLAERETTGTSITRDDIDDLHDHQAELSERLKTEEAEREENIYNRIHGVVESIDLHSRTMIVRTHDGGLVHVDPSSEKWQHAKGGLGIQHGYATTVSASQGWTRGRTFGMDHTGIGMRPAGVMMSRHRADCHIYVDKEARYLAKMKHTDAQEWHPIASFDDEECLARLASGWSRDSGKASTLDYDRWTDAEGRTIWVKQELQHAQAMEAHDKADIELAAMPQGSLMKFQIEETYRIAIERAKSLPTIEARQALADQGISGQVIIDAEAAGFVDFRSGAAHSADVAAVYLGRDSLAANARVVNVIDAAGARDPGALRHTFPPVLRGDDEHVVITPTGRDALAVWTQADSERRARPTVIVACEADELGPHRKALLRQAKQVEVTKSPASGQIADRARELAPSAAVEERNEQPAREAAAVAAEQARIQAEQKQLERGRER